MSRLALVAVIAASALGCGDNSPIYGEAVELPGQARAMELTWAKTFGATIPPPKVFWVMGARLDQADGTAFKSPNGTDTGLTDRDLPHHIQIAKLDGQPIGSGPQVAPGIDREEGTSFVHEACHSAAVQGITSDASADGTHHGGECFRLGGLVDQANAALRAESL
jgi:hypothetical protein